MKSRALTISLIVVMLLSTVLIASISAAPVAQGTSTRQIPAGGTTSIRAGAEGAGRPPAARVEARHASERRCGKLQPAHDRASRTASSRRSRSMRRPLPSSAVAGSNPELAVSVDGLNHRQQRLANGGNQFSLEPPDQGLCVGNGFVVEAVNSVLRVFDRRRRTADGRARSQHFLRLSGGDRSDDGRRRPQCD